MLRNLARGHIEMKAETKEANKNVRHLHYMVNKLCDGDLSEEETFDDALSKYVPCETFAELQTLDGKFADEDFFSRSVRTVTLCDRC